MGSIETFQKHCYIKAKKSSQIVVIYVKVENRKEKVEMGTHNFSQKNWNLPAMIGMLVEIVGLEKKLSFVKCSPWIFFKFRT